MTCPNQRLKIKHDLKDSPEWKESRENYNTKKDMKMILERNFEQEKFTKFFKETEIFEKINQQWRINSDKKV